MTFFNSGDQLLDVKIVVKFPRQEQFFTERAKDDAKRAKGNTEGVETWEELVDVDRTKNICLARRKVLNKLFIDQEVHKLSHKTEYPGYESAALNYALSVKNNKPKQNLLTRNNTHLEAEWNLKSLSNPSEQSVNPAIEMFRTHDNRLEQATAKKRKLNEDLRRKKIVLINRKELLKRHRHI